MAAELTIPRDLDVDAAFLADFFADFAAASWTVDGHDLPDCAEDAELRTACDSLGGLLLEFSKSIESAAQVSAAHSSAKTVTKSKALQDGALSFALEVRSSELRGAPVFEKACLCTGCDTSV